MTTSTTSISLPLAPGRWAVDTNHSSIGFSIRHLGVSKVRGRFARFDADVVIGATLDTTTANATVDVASIDTAATARAHQLSRRREDTHYPRSTDQHRRRSDGAR